MSQAVCHYRSGNARNLVHSTGSFTKSFHRFAARGGLGLVNLCGVKMPAEKEAKRRETRPIIVSRGHKRNVVVVVVVVVGVAVCSLPLHRELLISHGVRGNINL